MRRWIFQSVAALCLFLAVPTHAQDVPIQFTLPEAGYVTIVIDSADGSRIRNLIQNTYYPAGTHTINWDRTNEGRAVYNSDGSYDIKRSTLNSGSYQVRALYHKGIDLLYEFSVQSPGDPAWLSTDRKGGWLGDHTPPIDVLTLPGGKYSGNVRVVQVVAPIAETSQGFAYLDENGRKIIGYDHINNNHDFPSASTRDVGPNRNPEYLSWHAVHRAGAVKLVYAMSKNGKVSTNQFSTGIRTEAIHGIAAYNNLIAISYDGGIVFIDGKGAESKNYRIIRNLQMPNVRGIATDGPNLYVVEGKTVRRYK